MIKLQKFNEYNNTNNYTIYDDPKFVEKIENSIEHDGSSFICTSVAYIVKMLEGDKAKIYGFSQLHNPSALYFIDEDIDEDEGHHFVVIGDRYIIDPWIYNNYMDYNSGKIFGRSVFDLNDSGDKNIIKYLYGDKNKWVDITNYVVKNNQNFFKNEIDDLKDYKNSYVTT